MPVAIPEIKSAAASPVVQLAVVETPGRAAEADLGLLDAVKDRVEFAPADVKSEMVAFKFAVVVEQQRQGLVDPHRREITGSSALEPEVMREEFGRRSLVARRHDRVVERDGHGPSSSSRGERSSLRRPHAGGSRILERLIRLPELTSDPREARFRRFVFVVDVKGFGVRPGRLFLVAEALVSKPATGPGLQVLRL